MEKAQPPRRLSRAERKSATRAALIDAGERLVRRRGFAVSVEEIAAEAGFTKGAVYSNFAGRAELFEAIASRVTPGQQVMPDLDLPTLREAMADMARKMVAAIDADPEQVVLQLDGVVQLLRDPDLRAAILRGEAGTTGNPKTSLPWPLPIDARRWHVAINAVGMGLAAHRLLYGAEAVPEELFVWVNQRLADPT